MNDRAYDSPALPALSESSNIFELFLSFYEFLSEGGRSDAVRKIFAEPTSEALQQFRSWRFQDHRAAIDIQQSVSAYSPNAWLERFAIASNALFDCLQALARKLPTAEERLACYVISIRALDRILGAIFRHLENGTLTYPSPPSTDGYTLVYKRFVRFFNNYRDSEDLVPPPSLEHGEFDQALDLHSTYVVPPLKGGDYFDWDISKIPDSIEDVWRSQDRLRIVLLSFPHGLDELLLKIDEEIPNFRLVHLGDRQPQINKEVLRHFEEILHNGATVVLLPELTDNEDLRIELKAALKKQFLRVGLVLPGSRHLQDRAGNWRNRCSAIGPYGEEPDPEITHDKITHYALPHTSLAQRGFLKLAEGSKIGKTTVLEGISVTPRRIRIYDSGILGRLAVLICRDILEPPIREFCARHALDHIFVPAMSPSLEYFKQACSELGRVTDAGIYVANVCIGTKAHPAYLYLPVTPLRSIESCPVGEHEVCVSQCEFGATI